MAVVYIKHISSNVLLGIWKIEESLERLCDMLKNEELLNRISAFNSNRRKLEILSTHALLNTMLGCNNILIEHDKYGCPIVDNYYISISHTLGYVVIMLSNIQPVATDIEYYSERVNRVVGSYMRNDEYAPTLESRIVYWCAKETLYKYLPEYKLRSQEIRIQGIIKRQKGTVEAEEMNEHKKYIINYIINKDYVLAYMY